MTSVLANRYFYHVPWDYEPEMPRYKKQYASMLSYGNGNPYGVYNQSGITDTAWVAWEAGYTEEGSRYHSNLFYRSASINLIQRQGMKYSATGITYNSNDRNNGIGSTKLNNLTWQINHTGSREPYQHNNIRDRLGKS